MERLLSRHSVTVSYTVEKKSDEAGRLHPKRLGFDFCMTRLNMVLVITTLHHLLALHASSCLSANYLVKILTKEKEYHKHK